MRSWVSAERMDVEAWELRETLLAVGDSSPGFDCGDGADGSALGAPKTRPPPSVLLDMFTGT